MSATKRALLIGSRTKDGKGKELQGTENDVQIMALVLKKFGFEISPCIGSNATRDGILAAWQAIISATSADDAVVIYYSGHGSYVEFEPDEWEDHPGRDSVKYIVPTDIEQSTEDDFRGILDIELSYILRDTTERTRNVTLILDCCFSGRMVRGPSHGIRLVSKYRSTSEKYNIRKHAKGLGLDERNPGELLVEGNPNVVRIAAAASTELAYEYQNQQNQTVGILTDTLAEALDETFDQDISWRTTLLRVREIVRTRSSDPLYQGYLQHPQAEGPDTRILFSTKERVSGAHLIKMESKEAILQAGSVAGVRVGNVYVVMPCGFERIDSTRQIGKVRVISMNGFTSKLEFIETERTIISEVALAFLETAAPYKQPVSFPDDFEALRQRLEKSEFLRKHDSSEECEPIVSFEKEGNKLLARNSFGTLFFEQQATSDNSLENLVDAAILGAENQAIAQNILQCEGGQAGEALDHKIGIEFGFVSGERQRKPLTQDGSAVIIEGQRVYIELWNAGDTTFFVSVLDVNAAGDISLVSQSEPNGIEFTPGKDHTLGTRYGRLNGLKISWPKKVPNAVSIEETLIFVITSAGVDLRPLTNPRSTYLKSQSQGNISKFLKANSRGDVIRYDINVIPFLLHSVPVPTL